MGRCGLVLSGLPAVWRHSSLRCFASVFCLGLVDSGADSVINAMFFLVLAYGSMEDCRVDI